MPSEDKRFRLVVLIGAAGGGVMSIVTTFLLDVLYANSLGGTWRDAIASDVLALLSVSLDPKGFTVTLLFAVVVAVLAAFGALLGAVLATFIYKFLNVLARE